MFFDEWSIEDFPLHVKPDWAGYYGGEFTSWIKEC